MYPQICKCACASVWTWLHFCVHVCACMFLDVLFCVSLRCVRVHHVCILISMLWSFELWVSWSQLSPLDNNKEYMSVISVTFLDSLFNLLPHFLHNKDIHKARAVNTGGDQTTEDAYVPPHLIQLLKSVICTQEYCMDLIGLIWTQREVYNSTNSKWRMALTRISNGTH